MPDNLITQISAYDDYGNGLVRIEISNSHSSCPVGGFLNRDSVGFEQLYSLALVAASTKQSSIFQLHTNEPAGGLCEIDAIRLNFN